MNLPARTFLEPLILTSISLGWIACFCFASIQWFNMPVSTAWLMAGGLSFSFGFALLYLGYQFSQLSKFSNEWGTSLLLTRVPHLP